MTLASRLGWRDRMVRHPRARWTGDGPAQPGIIASPGPEGSGVGVEAGEVLGDHAVGREALDAHADGGAHHLRPACSVGEGGEDLVLEGRVERAEIAVILVRALAAVSDGPARHAV